MISYFKRFKLIFGAICLIFSSFQCPRDEPLYLTMVAGIARADCSDAEAISHVYLYEYSSFGQIVDSIALERNGRFESAFAGASLIELKGTELCASDWGWIRHGYKNHIELEHKVLKPLLEIEVNLPDSLDVKSLRFSVTRQLQAGAFLQDLYYDRNNYLEMHTDVNAVAPQIFNVVPNTNYRIRLVATIGLEVINYFDESILMRNTPVKILIQERKVL